MKSVPSPSADAVQELQSMLLCNMSQGGEGLGETGLAASCITDKCYTLMEQCSEGIEV